MFNRNMGCIEMRDIMMDWRRELSLIETWDVLKLPWYLVYALCRQV